MYLNKICNKLIFKFVNFFKFFIKNVYFLVFSHILKAFLHHFLTKEINFYNIILMEVVLTEFIHNVFATIFNDNIVLATILIATLPIIELRGAIPFATNTNFWNSLAMTNWTAFGWSFIGSSLIVPIIALIFIPLINWLKRTKAFSKLALSIENRVKSKAKGIENSDTKSKRFSRAYWKKLLAIFIFVAIPLPFTGVWTGTCIAVFIGLDYISTCFSVILGNAVAGLLITLILQFFPWLNNWLFYIFLILIAVILLYEIIKHIMKKKAQTSNNE